jgi:5-methylcytosine-specific restriction endonuclease McrA
MLKKKAWEKRRESMPFSERREWLKIKASRGQYISAELLRKRRYQFDQIKDRVMPLANENCWACGSVAEHRHHIISLHRGGENRRKNVIPLCRSCHQQIHPFMINELKDFEKHYGVNL